MVSLGVALSGLPGVQAVCWRSARSWMGPAYFRTVVTSWLEGGPFPSLGLVTMRQNPDGMFVSQGLKLFTGQEIVIAHTRLLGTGDQARIGLRLINELVTLGPVVEEQARPGFNGEQLRLTPIAHGRLLRVSIRK